MATRARTSTMSTVDDLRLALAVAEHGSLSGAAAAMELAQPSLSQRLAVLERRLGVTLFDRTTRGSRPTAAGLAYVERARQAITLIESAGDDARSAGRLHQVRVGTFHSASVAVFDALDRVLDGVRVAPRVDHGGVVVTDVAAGVLDLGVVSLGRGVSVPPGASVTSLGDDDLVVVAPPGTRASTSRRFLRGRTVVHAAYTMNPDDVAARLVARGPELRLAGNAPAALAIARRRGLVAAVPRSAWLVDVHPGESVAAFDRSWSMPLSLVTSPREHPVTAGLAPRLGEALGLRRAGRVGRGARTV